MKESQWRSKLVADFRKRKQKGFIWAHDAKFKAGYPDLQTIVKGLECHYELKVSDRYKNEGTFEMQLKRLFEPIQIAIMTQMREACGRVRGLVLQSDKSVLVFNFEMRTVKRYEPYEFDYCWMTDNFL